MSRAARGFALVAALLAVGGLAWWLFGGGGPATTTGREETPPRPSRPGATGAPSASPDPSPGDTGTPEAPRGPLLRGRVTDGAGRPVAGASVEVRAPAEEDPLDIRVLGDALFTEKPPRARAISGPDGAFAIPGLAAGTWDLIARAPGWAPGRAEGVVFRPPAETPPVVLVLGPGHALLVRVVEAGGEPVGGAEVVATRLRSSQWPMPGDAYARAATDATGTARLEGLDAGLVYVVARAGGRVAARGVNPPGDRELEIRIGGTASLAVRVLAEGGGPLEGASVSAVLSSPETSGGSLLRGATDPEGVARFDGLLPGRVALLSAEKTGFAPQVLGGSGARGPLHDEFATLREESVLEIEVRLRPGATLLGTVRLASTGASVPGARVTLLVPGFLAFGPRRTAVADAEGAYRVEGLPGGRAVVYAHAEGAASAGALPGGIPAEVLAGQGRPSPLTVEVQEGPAETRHDLLVEATGSVSGRVLGADGAPAAGARVTVRARLGGGDLFEPGEDLPPTPALAGPDGTFRVEGVPPAKGLFAAATLGGRVPGVSSSFDLEAGGAAEGLEIRLAAGGVVLGRVSGPDGAPVAGASVRVAPRIEQWRAGSRARLEGEGPRDGVTIEDGSFRIDAVPAGAISVTATAEGFVRRSLANLEAREGEETRADLALDAGLEIRGRVLSATGTPVPEARVAARNSDRQPPSGVRSASATTRGDGSFVLDGLPRGTWSLTVTSPDHPRTTVPSVDSGGPPIEVRFALPVRISGRVTDLSGNPVPGIRVDASPAFEGGASGGGVSRTDGTFEIRNLVAGPHRLDARPRSGWSERRIEGVEGGATGIEIRLEKALTISGRVLGPDGNPAAGRGRIRVLDAAGNQVGIARWDGRGEFRTGGIPEGTYSLRVRVEGMPVLVATATAAAGSEGVVLRLQGE